jgi:hypothetical protein
VVTCLAVALIIAGGLTRLDFGLMAWRAGGGGGTRLFDGVPLPWEWLDTASSVWFLGQEPEWTSGSYILRSAHVRRFTHAVATALLGGWTGDARRAAILVSWLSWGAAAAAQYALCRALIPQRARAHRIGCTAAVLVALGPGFAAFFGTIDVRPGAYAAAALALLALERARQLRLARPARLAEPGQREARGHPLIIAAVLFLANGTLELGPPLLGMLWLVCVALETDAGRAPLRERVRWAGIVTAAYVALDTGWVLLAHVVALGRVSVSGDNDAWLHVSQNLRQFPPEWGLVTARLWGVRDNALAAFTPPVVALAAAGLLALPRRAALWAAAWIGITVAALLLTRQWPRTLYLAFWRFRPCT